MRNGLKMHFNQGTQQQPQFRQENEEIQMMFVTVLLSENCHTLPESSESIFSISAISDSNINQS